MPASSAPEAWQMSTSSLMSRNSPTPTLCLLRSANTGTATPAPLHKREACLQGQRVVTKQTYQAHGQDDGANSDMEAMKAGVTKVCQREGTRRPPLLVIIVTRSLRSLQVRQQQCLLHSHARLSIDVIAARSHTSLTG